eukprot:scaffold4635_cov267-Pinguiococcus_pyrenoidosus.AAC.30
MACRRARYSRRRHSQQYWQGGLGRATAGATLGFPLFNFVGSFSAACAQVASPRLESSASLVVEDVDDALLPPLCASRVPTASRGAAAPGAVSSGTAAQTRREDFPAARTRLRRCRRLWQPAGILRYCVVASEAHQDALLLEEHHVAVVAFGFCGIGEALEHFPPAPFQPDSFLQPLRPALVVRRYFFGAHDRSEVLQLALRLLVQLPSQRLLHLLPIRREGEQLVAQPERQVSAVTLLLLLLKTHDSALLSAKPDAAPLASRLVFL